jgi:hypothetical protein
MQQRLCSRACAGIHWPANIGIRGVRGKGILSVNLLNASIFIALLLDINSDRPRVGWYGCLRYQFWSFLPAWGKFEVKNLIESWSETSLAMPQMETSSPICLRFGNEILPIVRSRMFYAFQVFAAIYNHRVVEPGSCSDAIHFVYGESDLERHDSKCVFIPPRYRHRPLESHTIEPEKFCYGGETFYLVYGIDERTKNPDWLAELFEWISSSYEMGVPERDETGRIPYLSMIFNRQGMSPRKPYASILMAWLENALQNGSAVEALPKAPCPVRNAGHIVVSSHDIDFYYVGRTSALVRLFKNLGIAFRLYRSWSFFFSNSIMILQLAGGRRVGDYLPALIESMRDYEFSSTLFVVAQHSHRRDPDYRLEDLQSHLRGATNKTFSVELHGSYKSIIEAATLVPDILALQRVTGKKTLGNRQHWLRFDYHAKLFEALERAEMVFDSTLGFAETVGFRNGASFAFPPYNFKEEKPHNFLEIPLVLMDGNLEAAARTLEEEPQKIADEVLGESRKWGWGGIGSLWHNPLEPISVPDKINKVFWNCVERQQEFNEKWMSANNFLECCLSRYQNAGLLAGVSVNA